MLIVGSFGVRGGFSVSGWCAFCRIMGELFSFVLFFPVVWSFFCWRCSDCFLFFSGGWELSTLVYQCLHSSVPC